MSNTKFEYGFWFWKEKLLGVLTMLAALVDHDLEDEEFEVIHQELRHTSDVQDIWNEYILGGASDQLKIRLAYDGEDTDIIFIRINSSPELQPKLEALALFQSLFKQLEPER